MNTALIVFAKAPTAGQVKTRLIPALGADGAAQLAHRLLAHTLLQSMDFEASYWELCASPNTQHEAFAQAVQSTHGKLQLVWQGEGDLGERMHRAFERVLATQSAALLIGTDAPALTSCVLRQAQQALDSHDAVFVPAYDGGYCLVGLRQPAPQLFQGLAWSTHAVMSQTRELARALKLTWTELDPIHDIDEPADLVHLPLDWRST